MAFDFAGIPSAIKELYSPEEVRIQTYKKRALWALMPKRQDLGGLHLDSFLVYGNAATGSHSFSTAVTNGNVAANTKFVLSPKQDYVVPPIDNMTIKATRNDKMAFIGALDLAMKTSMSEIADSFAIQLAGDGTGIRGTVISSYSSGNTFGLSDSQQSVNFYTNQAIQAAFLSGGSWTLRASQMVITNIDRNGGNITCSGGVVSGLAAGDVLVRAGDLATGQASNNQCGVSTALSFPGLAGFLPLNRPQAGTGDSFGGVDRSADQNRLAGCFFDASSGLSPEEAINGLMTLIDREGGEPDVFVVNPLQWNKFRNSLSSKVEYESVEAFDEPQISFGSMKYASASGKTVNIIADRFLPSNLGYALQLDTWMFWSMGEAPGLLDYDMYGQAVVPQATSDGIQLRYGGYCLLECTAPGWNGVVKLQ